MTVKEALIFLESIPDKDRPLQVVVTNHNDAATELYEEFQLVVPKTREEFIDSEFIHTPFRKQ